MQILAVYGLRYHNEFISFEQFTTAGEREAFEAAIKMSSQFASFDTDPYLRVYKMPDGLDEIDFDDHLYERWEKFKYDQNVVE